jgi:hypothetical protein
MKKLMLTLAASLAVTALVAVESQNIVGYTTTSMPDAYQYQMYSPMFITVGGATNSIPLGSLSANQDFGDNGDYITFMDAAGSWTINATYYPGYGWFDPDDPEIDRDDVVIAAGTGFMVSTVGEGGEILCAGEVGVGDLEVALPGPYQYVMVGNPTPVALTLGDVVANQDFGDNGDYITFMDAAGSWTINATFYPGYGWFDPDDPEIDRDDVVLQPGTTFMVSTVGSGGVITFPSPL